ncbi:hypothetical protein BC828DRAFT_361401 [Blastocladiella britannica]|nr:hypothetical protein BC828DRAFT_361401 [Blastocladiella britannica]
MLSPSATAAATPATLSLNRPSSRDNLLLVTPAPEHGSEEIELASATSRSVTAAASNKAPAAQNHEPVFTSNAAFPLSIETLQTLTDNRDKVLLGKLGGLSGVAAHLQVDPTAGLSSGELAADLKGTDKPAADDAGAAVAAADHDLLPEGHELGLAFAARRHAYGTNFLPPSPPPSFLSLCLDQLEDRMLQILIVSAVVSLGVGLYMKFSGVGDPNEWIEGLAIMATVAFVVLVNAGNDYKKALQFRFLSSQRGVTSMITVLRQAHTGSPAALTQIPVIHLQVGDVVHLATGDVVPADGLLIDAHQCRTDESSVTGETDAVSKKHTGDVFLISGSKVVEGICQYLVTSVGVHSLQGRSAMSLRTESELTPLQVKLVDMAESIAKFGVTAAALIIVAGLIKFFILYAPSGFKEDDDGTVLRGSEIAERLIKVFITGVTVVVVAVPEGLPMAVTLALGFATIRMMKDNNLVRVLASCETMGGCTTICSDKTGTLTQNRMTVVQGTFFDGAVVFTSYEQVEQRLNAADVHVAARELLVQGIHLNSTAHESASPDSDKIEMVGSKTEIALLEFTAQFHPTKFAQTRAAAVQVGVIPFSSERKRMSTVIKIGESADSTFVFDHKLDAGADGGIPSHGPVRIFTKGASELVLASCEYMVNAEGKVVPLTAERRTWFMGQIEAYATDALRAIGMAYKDIPVPADESELKPELDQAGLVWLGVAGIMDPLRPEVPPAVARCQAAGITVRMVTGDNGVTARNIAKRCGILVDEVREVVMEGPQFRTLSDAEMRKILPRLRVLARSSPLDKRILVNKLKEMGETVAVTGDGTNDAPALKAADVGFAMGIAGTEVAKEASDIILMDDNFASLVKAVMWGRSVYDAVRKFLQFQLSVNVTAVGLAIVSAMVDTRSRAIVSAVQLLWVNLIMDTLAALALATDPPTEDLLNRKPHKKSDPLISYDMWKMLSLQSVYQLAVCITLYFTVESMFGFSIAKVKADPSTGIDIEPVGSERFLESVEQYVYFRTSAILFNVFVWMQVFNMFNARTIHGEYNVFARMQHNPMFLGIMVFVMVLQAIIVQFGARVFGVVPLNGTEWAMSVGFGFVSLPLGLVIRMLPDVGRAWFEDKFYDHTAEQERARLAWDEAIRKTAIQARVVSAFRSYKSGDAPGVVVMG